mgnify:FL=1
MKMKEKVIEVIDDLRPFLMNDGGNIEFVKIEDNIVYVRLQGACMGCPMREVTLKDGIEKTILEKVPEIKEVRLVNED